MLTLLLALAAGAALFAWLGAGVHLLLTPRWLDRPLLRPVLCWIYGQAVFAIVFVYVWALDLSLQTGLIAALVIGGALLVVGVARAPGHAGGAVKEVVGAVRRRWPWVVAIGLVGLVGLVPAHRHAESTTPYRTGIDQAGYAISANAIAHDKTRSSIERGLREQTDAPDNETAAVRAARTISVNQQVEADFLLTGLRRTYSQAIAATGRLIGADSVWQVAFLLSGLATLALTALTAGALRAIFHVPHRWAFAGGVLAALNCNLLNAWFQGAYGQTWVAPLGLLAVVAVLMIRSTAAPGWPGEIRRAAGVVGLAVAGILPAYADVATALAAVFCITVGFDFVTRWEHARVAATRVATGGLLALLLVVPFSVEFLRFAPERYRGASANGFFQPHWATPAEITGLWDMYKETSYALIPTEIGTMRLLIVLSLLVGIVVYWSLKRLKGPERRVFLALLGFALLVFYRTRFELNATNYQFYKIYTYLTPAMVLLLVGGLTANERSSGLWTPTKPIRRGVLALGPTAALAVTVGIVAFVGVNAIRTMREQSRFVTPPMLALASDPDAQRILSKSAVVIPPTNKSDDRLTMYMVAGLVTLNWVNRRQEVIVTGRPRLPVAVALIEGQEGLCLPCIRREHPDRVLLDRRALLLISARATLGDITDAAVDRYSQRRLRGALRRAGAPDLAALFPGDRVDPV